MSSKMRLNPACCCRSYLAQTGLDSWLLADWNAYDQYEVSIPIEEAADCLVKVLLALLVSTCFESNLMGLMNFDFKT